MTVEDTLIAKKKKKIERVETRYVHHLEQGPCPKKAKTGDKRDRDGKTTGSSSGRYSNYMPLNTSLDHVLMQIKENPSLNWPNKMKGDTSTRNTSKYCRFH